MAHIVTSLRRLAAVLVVLLRVMCKRKANGKQMLSSWGLRSRLALLAGMALLPVLGLYAWMAAEHQHAAVQLAQSRLQSEAMLLAAGQQPLVEAARQLLGDIVNAPVVRAGQGEACADYLRRLQAQQPAYAEIGVMRPGGELLCHSGGAEAGTRAGHEALLSQALQRRQLVIGDHALARSGGKSGVAFALPVYSGGETLVAVAFTVVDLQAFGAALAMAALPAHTRAVLLDPRGTVLAVHPPGAERVGSPQADPALRELLQTPLARGAQALDAEGQARVYAFVPVPGAARQALFVGLSQPRVLVTAAAQQAFVLELAMLLGAAALGMLLAWWMGQRLIIWPAHAILREANELAIGNLSARVAVGPDYRGELGHLARTFNRMAGSLQLRRSELDSALARIGKEHRMLDLIINSMSEGVLAIDVQGRFLLFNAAARKTFPVEEVGMNLTQWRTHHEVWLADGSAICPPQDRPLSRAVRGESMDNWDLLLRRPGSKDRVLRNNIRPLRDEIGGLVGGLVVFTDITERKFADDFVHDQEQVLELIAGGVPLGRSLEAIVALIEGRSPDSLCSVLLREGGHLRHAAAPSLPDAYNRQIDGLEIAEGAGVCGTAAFLKKPVVVTDASTDPLTRDYRELMRAHGLQSCWSTPVLSSDGDVLATFAIYHRTSCQPQPQDQGLMDTAVRLARIAIERMRTEAALLSSEGRFRELAENVDDVFYNRDVASGRFLYISPAYETLWRQRLDHLYQDADAFLAAVHPEDRPRVTAAKAQHLRGAISDLAYRLVWPDGQVRWVRDHAYPVRHADGVVERVVGTVRDITDRKQADLELARTHRALQMLSRCNAALTRIDDETALLAQVCQVAVEVGGYRMAWVGYAQYDAQRSIRAMAHAGHEDGYLSRIQLSWDADQLTGRGPAGQCLRSGEVRVSEDITRSDNHFHGKELALQQGYRSAVFLPLRNSSGTFGLLSLYSATVEKFAAEETTLLQELVDNLAFGIGNVRSQLERKQAQEEILRLNAELEERVCQRTAQLEMANRELEAFSYSVSHDLRTPLSAIDGFSGLLTKELANGGMSGTRAPHFLNRIRAGVAQMGALIDALLSLAQVSKTSLRVDRVNLSALAEQVIAAYRERDPERTVQVEIEPGLWTRGDARLLLQVLDNLLGNAWKFSARQPQAHISLSQAPSVRGQTTFVVRDNGAGFDMAYSEKLFDVFQRLHAVTEFEGTGVGLATVQRIVTRHGGAVWAESAPGEGAAFYFSLGVLPLEEAGAVAAPGSKS